MTAASIASWSVRGRTLDLARPLIMGIVNVTPDSFSDGGRYLDHGAARAHAERLVAEGADILDIGGESTRPGAADVPVAVEIERVVPLIAALQSLNVPLSIDTSKTQVMQAALDAGAAIVNDVRALRDPGALRIAADAGCGIVLMHMQGSPRSMQTAPSYADVVAEVAGFLAARCQAAIEAGVLRDRIAIDPGFGFGKTTAHNFCLLEQLSAFAGSGFPVLIGISRKSMLGAATGRNVGDRQAASLAATLLAVERGARIVRV
ncbi:MAG: dihydropteroate synthase, partial [Burkholderiaceae bacterium]